MFSSRSSKPGTPISSSRLGRSFTPNRNSGSFFSSLRSPFTPGTTGNLSFTANLQCSIIQESAVHAVENYGMPLPVLVTEVITMAESGTEISAKISSNGWAWLVCGRRLFVWKYKQESETRNVLVHCRELMLPQSDLAHKVELVCVLINKEPQMPSVLAVSPEGIVRYWPNIAHEGSSVESAADLQGQECFSLTNIQPLGCILATTTSSLVLISPSLTDGQNIIVCRTLKTPQGMLTGIGRRVSSFIFGAMPNQSSESKQLIKVLAADGVGPDGKFVYVLTGNSLQKWHLSEVEPDKLIFDCDIERYVKESFLNSLWNQDSSQIHLMKTWCLDMQFIHKGIMIFVAGINPEISQELHYGFGTLESSAAVPSKFSSFSVIKHSRTYLEGEEEKLLNYRFLFPFPKGPLAYVYDTHKVIAVYVFNPDEEPDIVEFSAHGNKILGAGTCDRFALFFSNINGIVVLTPTVDLSSQWNKTFTSDISLMESEEAVEDSNELGNVAKIKKAMLLFCEQKLLESQRLLDTSFPIDVVSTTQSSLLDSTVYVVSREIIDDFPASDPRWMDSFPSDESVCSSVILYHQLNDKVKAHELLLVFLKSVGLWNRLHSVKVPDGEIATGYLLLEHAEKIVAAKSLRKLHDKFNTILDTSIKNVIAKRGTKLKDHLTHQDLFYREVSRIEDIFGALVEEEENQLVEAMSGHDIVNVILSVNTIFLEVLKEVCVYRENKISELNIIFPLSNCEYIPWTSAEGSFGLRTLLLKQHSISVDSAATLSDDIHVKGTLFQQLVDLGDIILNGYKSQLNSVKNWNERYTILQARYHQHRHELITALYVMEHYEKAAALAEKHNDFNILVQFCEETENYDRLQRYILQFADQGFADIAFKWYLDNGKRGKLLSLSKSYPNELSEFLKNHESISWLHAIQTDKYSMAQQTLKKLALKEEEYLAKKKSLLSLSKLTALASDAPADIKNSQIEAINVELDLVLYQETLPVGVLETLGFDTDNMRVLTPEELIEIYISDENSGANHFDYKKALDLLTFIKKPSSDQDVENLRMHIWCSAILRDSWDDLDTDNPIEFIKNTLFFRVVELAYDQGVDLHDFLPPLDVLIDRQELSAFKDNPSFLFSIQAGYEQIMKIID